MITGYEWQQAMTVKQEAMDDKQKGYKL